MATVRLNNPRPALVGELMDELASLLKAEAGAIRAGKAEQLREIVTRKQSLAEDLELTARQRALATGDRERLTALREQNLQNGALLLASQQWVSWTLRRLGRIENSAIYGGKGFSAAPKILQKNLAMA